MPRMFTYKITTVSGKSYCAGKFESISNYGMTERAIVHDAMCRQSEDCFKHMISSGFVHISQAYEDTIWLEFGEMPERDTSRTWYEIMAEQDNSEFNL
jgi:hypothetical protein